MPERANPAQSKRRLARLCFVVLAAAVLWFLGSRQVDVQLGVIWYDGPARVPVALLVADVVTTVALLVSVVAVLAYTFTVLWRVGWGRP